jgi:hypothetical protein
MPTPQMYANAVEKFGDEKEQTPVQRTIVMCRKRRFNASAEPAE